MDIQSITTTDFSFPGQTSLYHGKVRDVYSIGEDVLVSVATDRISAFDVILPKAIPYKGQVLNQLAAHFLAATKDIVPNWLLDTPDPNVSVGYKAEPIRLEMIIRGYLVGYAWRQYDSGAREICGIPLPDGMHEYDAFEQPIITPTTKAEAGHDEDISEADILGQKIVSAEQWSQLSEYTQALFARGQAMAAERGLILVDTKYEFGIRGGNIILIDEIHTPDSSRYVYKDSYDAYRAGQQDEPPRQLSKEFVRSWLLKHDFSGQPGQPIPEMSDEFVANVSERYIELYQELTGQSFERAPANQVIARIETNVKEYLGRL